MLEQAVLAQKDTIALSEKQKNIGVDVLSVITPYFCSNQSK